MMDEKIDRIVELDIDDEQLDDELFEDTGVEIVSIVDRPAIQADFLYFNEEKFVEPNAGETEDEFIGRCMSKLDTEFPDEEQRLAVCYSYWKPTNLYWKEIEEKFETYNDYPEGAKNNACRAVEFAEKNGWGDCGTDVGKQRAHQLCKGENISEDTISRMASFARHEQHKDVPYTEGCGGLMWDAWGGSAGINWAQSKLEELKMSCGDDCKKDYYTEEEQKEILMYAEDDNNGYYIGKDDLYIDMTLNKFAGIGDVITAIRSLDILKRLSIKKEEPPEVYWRYSGPPAQRDFCKAMLRLADRGKIFTTDEVNKMSSLNRDFGPRGNSSYDKLSWKGGPNCVHYWTKLEVFKGDTGNKVIIASNRADNTKEEKAMKSNNQRQPSPQGHTPNNAFLKKRNFSFNIDEEKRIVMGPVMIPNKMILRRDENGEPFYIYFSKKTIRKMAEKFFRKNNHNNTDINHDENITNNNTLIESWISESIKHDKSYKYGFALPEGTWYVSYKINDDKTWELIKSGELKGFSLAGGFIQKMKPIDPEQTLNDIKDILKKVKK